MVGTLPMNRLGYDSPPVTLPELPKTARERGFLWSDAVFQAVLALQKQLTHPNSAIVAAAANSILGLEETRLRHGRDVAGSEGVSTMQLEFEAEEREAEENRARHRAAPQPEIATEPSANERALADHGREVAEALEKKGKPLPVRPVRFVEALLKTWGLEASAIPAGEFMCHYKKLGIGPTPLGRPIPRLESFAQL